MKSRLICLTLATIALAPIHTQAQVICAVSGNQKKKPETPRIVKLTIHPAAEPQPALKYLLLPNVLDQTSGNANTLLQSAGQLADRAKENEPFKDWQDWLDLPADQLPREKIQQLADHYKRALRHAKLAAAREWCEWDLPVRSEGFDLLLPSLASFRNVAKLLAIQIRMDIADQRYDDAIDKLQTALAMARYVGKGPTIINALVGIAITGLMTDQMELWTECPDSPNLYWALANLPDPFIDLHRPMQLERSVLYFPYPQLRNLKDTPMTPQQWEPLHKYLLRTIGMVMDSNMDKARSEMQEVTTTIYPKAKQYLIALGKQKNQVEAMPVQQVVASYLLDRYNHWRDQLCKHAGMPYWQVYERWTQIEGEFGQIRKDPAEGYPLIELVPSLLRAHFHAARMARRLAALRCIEAIRMYAASRDGKLPPNLGAITEAPIPINPVTGKAFGYKVTGNTAVLDAPALEGHSPEDSTRYEITIAK